MKKVLLFCTCLLLSACASRSTTNTSNAATGGAAVATQADLDRVKAKFPDLTLAKLESGRMSYEEDCASCHQLKNPKDYSEDHIRMIVPVMAKKSNDKAGRTVVDLEEQDLIMKYMVAINTR